MPVHFQSFLRLHIALRTFKRFINLIFKRNANAKFGIPANW